MTRRLKVVFLSRYQGRVNRGAERVVDDLVKVLSEDFDVDILSGKKADSVINVIQGRYDVVIPVNGRWQAFKVSLGRIFGRYKLVITGHSGLGIDDLWNLIVVRPDVFVSLTLATLNHWKMRVGKWLAFGVKVVHIPNGVDLKEFSPVGIKTNVGLASPIVMCVGALVPQKRHELVIRAIAKTKQMSLLIVGVGPEKQRLEKLGNMLIGGRFRMMSADFGELAGLYRAANLFTLPSWDREAFGLVYLEAMASGLGIVAPDDNLRHEIVGSAGIFVDVTDAEKYAQALVSALDVDWSSRAIAQAGKFNWRDIGTRYRDLILQLF